MNKIEKVFPDYPCVRCRTRCNKEFCTCNKWIAWFGKHWRELTQGGQEVQTNRDERNDYLKQLEICEKEALKND